MLHDYENIDLKPVVITLNEDSGTDTPLYFHSQREEFPRPAYLEFTASDQPAIAMIAACEPYSSAGEDIAPESGNTFRFPINPLVLRRELTELMNNYTFLRKVNILNAAYNKNDVELAGVMSAQIDLFLMCVDSSEVVPPRTA